MNAHRHPASLPGRVCSGLVLIAALLAAAAAARADCLTGTGATGFEAGRQTVIVRPFTGSGEVSASSLPDCEPRSLFVEPGIHPGGTGRAEVAAHPMGYSQGAYVSVSGGGTGTAYADALGSVRYAFRVESDKGYTGPGQVDVDLDILLDIGGNISLSGAGSSASAAYTVSGGLRRADQLLGIELFSFAGGSVGGVPLLLEFTHSLDIDGDYILSFASAQQVRATSAGLMTSSAAYDGTTRISYGIGVGDATGLSVVFPMVAALGVAPPIIGAPPLLPSELTPPPIPEPGVYMLMSVGLGLVAWAARRRMRPAVPRLEGRSDATWAIAPQ